MNRIAGVFGAVIVLTLAACGGEAVPTGDDAGTVSTTMECYGVSAGCDTGTEFCLVSKSGSIQLAGMCAKLPAHCNSCDCADSVAESEWLRENPGTDNCTGAVVTCSQRDTAITLTCQK